jgi:hypothetical protein
MPAILTIGGVAFDSWLARESLAHADNLTASPDTLDFNLNAINGAGVRCPKPAVGAEVIYTLPTGTRLFGGALVSAPQVLQGFNAVAYSCACSDYRIYADRRTLNDQFTAKTAGQIIVALFTKYAPEFDISLVDLTGYQIPSFRCKRSDRITTIMDALSKSTGYLWDINPNKQVIWAAPGTLTAPFGLTDTSRNFTNLQVTAARDQLQNRVIVKGAKYPATTATVDRWNGDGLTTGFRLSKQPFGTDGYVLFEDQFKGLAAATWNKVDVTNPSPPAGHTGADGYIFTTLQQGGSLTESGKLQVVGGSSVWGASRLTAVVPIARGDGFQRFEMDVYPQDVTGQGRVGLWDPSNLNSLSGEVYGFHFNAGNLVPSEAGVDKTALVTVTYTAAAGSCIRIRVIPNVTTGAEYYVNTDAANGFRASQWQHLYSSATGAQPTLTQMPAFNYNWSYRVGRVKVFKRLYNFGLTVGGVAKTVGVLNVDTDGGYDALIGTEAGDAPVLAFFGDTIPLSGTNNIVATYYESIPVLTQADDAVSQAAVKALENPGNLANGSDGIYEGYLEDLTLDTLALARQRATQQLLSFSNPLVTATFDTNAEGLKAGQVINCSLTSALSGRDLSGSYLIQDIRTRSLGSGMYVHSVTAGSRLKGIEEYLIELLMAGKAAQATVNDNSPLDVLVSAYDTLALSDTGSVTGPRITAVDTVTFTDAGSVTNGPLPPYVYGTAQYGLSSYA